MSQHNFRKPLALMAVLASSVAAVAVSTAQAGATTYGMKTSPVTVTVGNVVHVVGGGTVTLPVGAHDVSWAGDGSRLAFIDDRQSVYTADPDGSHIVAVAPASQDPSLGMRSHTVWSADDRYVIWSEFGASLPKLVKTAADGSWATEGLPPQTLIDPAALAAAGLRSDVGLHNPDVAAGAGDSVVFRTSSEYVSPSPAGVAVASWVNGTVKVTQVVPIPSSPQNYGAVGDDTQPTISPDGKTIVYVDPKTSELFAATRNADGSWTAGKQVTFGNGVHSAPIFEVDGKTVAFSRTDGTYTVDVTAATATANTETRISTDVGVPAVRTDTKSYELRLAGSDRTDTAVKASQQVWGDVTNPKDARTKANSVTLSRSDLFADALGGAGLASHKGGPLLLTETATLSDETRTEIQRILPTGATVYLLGGKAAISPAVETKLKQLGYSVQRIGGQNRFDTAVQIAKQTSASPSEVLVATGNRFPDALSAGAVAAAYQDSVVVLTDDGAMPKETARYLNSLSLGGGSPTAYAVAVGGQARTALKSAGWATQNFRFGALVGQDRFQTSYLVASAFFDGEQAIGVATGADWPDALSGGALMGQAFGPLLLVDPQIGLTPADDDLIHAHRGTIISGVVFGGLRALPHSVDTQLAADVATPGGVQIQSARVGSGAAKALPAIARTEAAGGQ